MVIEYTFGCHSCEEVRTYEVGRMGDKPAVCENGCNQSFLYRAWNQDDAPHATTERKSKSNEGSGPSPLQELSDALDCPVIVTPPNATTFISISKRSDSRKN